MNSTLTRIAVTMKNGQILPTPSTKAIGTLPLMTYKNVAGDFIYKYGTWAGEKQPLCQFGITLLVDGVEVGTGAHSVMIKDAVEAWAKSHGIEKVSVMIR